MIVVLGLGTIPGAQGQARIFSSFTHWKHSLCQEQAQFVPGTNRGQRKQVHFSLTTHTPLRGGISPP